MSHDQYLPFSSINALGMHLLNQIMNVTTGANEEKDSPEVQAARVAIIGTTVFTLAFYASEYASSILYQGNKVEAEVGAAEESVNIDPSSLDPSLRKTFSKVPEALEVKGKKEDAALIITKAAKKYLADKRREDTEKETSNSAIPFFRRQEDGCIWSRYCKPCLQGHYSIIINFKPYFPI